MSDESEYGRQTVGEIRDRSATVVPPNSGTEPGLLTPETQSLSAGLTVAEPAHRSGESPGDGSDQGKQGSTARDRSRTVGTAPTLSRRTLPPRRESETFEVTFWKLPWLVSVGFYEDHVTPGEVFVTGAKSGTDVEATAHDAAILLSLAMQHGVPLATIDAALIKNSDGSPGSLIGAVVKKLGGR